MEFVRRDRFFVDFNHGLTFYVRTPRVLWRGVFMDDDFSKRDKDYRSIVQRNNIILKSNEYFCATLRYKKKFFLIFL